MKIVKDFGVSTKDRYSTENLAEFKDYTAEAFHRVLTFELDDEDHLALIFGTHGNLSMVSVFYQLISMLFLAEGAQGKITWTRGIVR